ncbi:MAG: hypothetical protein HY319_24400 [Armatimonadetes bacterium]|nr:hypothetical protein [Armatimonadota bacterium]
MLEATGADRVSSPVAAQAENALMGCGGSLWLIVGGFMLSLTVWGAFFGIPMILAGVLLPAAECIMAWRGQDWSGATESDNRPVSTATPPEPPSVATATVDPVLPESLRGDAKALCETLKRWRGALAPGSESGRRAAAALDELVGVLQKDLQQR